MLAKLISGQIGMMINHLIIHATVLIIIFISLDFFSVALTFYFSNASPIFYYNCFPVNASLLVVTACV